jgi:hypothetical protein
MQQNNTIAKAIFLLIALCLLVFFLFQSCRDHTEPFIPERHESIREDQYETRRKKLVEAYEAENYFSISFYLATLKSPSEAIYNNLRKAVKHDTSACAKIFDVRYLAEQGFYRYVYKIDTTEFEKVFDLCITQKGSNAYDLYKQKEMERARLYRESRPPLDSALFDWKLMEILKEIEEDDQRLRIKMNALGNSEAEIARLLVMRNKIDSLNLVRVDSILTYVGYPTREKVGHDYTDVVALIVHHQSDPTVRQAYLDRIRPYLSLERVELIENRTQEILRGN